MGGSNLAQVINTRNEASQFMLVWMSMLVWVNSLLCNKKQRIPRKNVKPNKCRLHLEHERGLDSLLEYIQNNLPSSRGS